MRRLVTRRLTRIQAIWHSDNIFINFEQHWNTLKIKADKKLADDNLCSGLRVNRSYQELLLLGNQVVPDFLQLVDSVPEDIIINCDVIYQKVTFYLRSALFTCLYRSSHVSKLHGEQHKCFL